MSAMEMAKGLGAPATPCSHNPVLWTSAGQLRDPESQGWKGHHVAEETEAQEKEGPHPESPAGLWRHPHMSRGCWSILPGQLQASSTLDGVGETQRVPFTSAWSLGSALCGHLLPS